MIAALTVLGTGLGTDFGLLDLALAALFGAGAILALSVLVLAWRDYGGQFRAIRAQLATLGETREFIVRTAMIEMSGEASGHAGSIAPRPARHSRITRAAAPAPRARPALRAAA